MTISITKQTIKTIIKWLIIVLIALAFIGQVGMMNDKLNSVIKEQDRANNTWPVDNFQGLPCHDGYELYRGDCIMSPPGHTHKE